MKNKPVHLVAWGSFEEIMFHCGVNIQSPGNPIDEKVGKGIYGTKSGELYTYTLKKLKNPCEACMKNIRDEIGLTEAEINKMMKE